MYVWHLSVDLRTYIIERSTKTNLALVLGWVGPHLKMFIWHSLDVHKDVWTVQALTNKYKCRDSCQKRDMFKWRTHAHTLTHCVFVIAVSYQFWDKRNSAMRDGASWETGNEKSVLRERNTRLHQKGHSDERKVVLMDMWPRATVICFNSRRAVFYQWNLIKIFSW